MQDATAFGGKQNADTLYSDCQKSGKKKIQ